MLYISHGVWLQFALHAVLSLAVVCFLSTRKRLSTRAHRYTVGVLLAVVCLLFVGSIVLVPRDLPQRVYDEYVAFNNSLAPTVICIRELDYVLSVVFVLWSAALLYTVVSRGNRTAKLTLDDSCQYVALHYGCNYQHLLTLCQKHGYAFFPISDLEHYLSVHGHDPLRVSDVRGYLEGLDEQETDRAEGERNFKEESEAARVRFNLTQNPLVLQRRRDAAMSYEQYRALRQHQVGLIAMLDDTNSVSPLALVQQETKPTEQSPMNVAQIEHQNRHGASVSTHDSDGDARRPRQ